MRLLVVVVFVVACGNGPNGVDASPSTTLGGAVSLQSVDSTSLVTGVAHAGFDASSNTTCTIAAPIGGCEIAACAGSSTPPAASAGTITVTGANVPITLTPAADKTYPLFRVAAPLFVGGESITFSATGADVPAFTSTVTAPAKATITAPAKPTATFLPITLAQDFTVAWTGGGSGKIEIVISGGGNRVTCAFPASGGTGTVPSAALVTLPAGQGNFVISAFADSTQAVGTWSVGSAVGFNSIWPDNSGANGPATLQ